MDRETLKRATEIAEKYAANGHGIREWASEQGIDPGEILLAAESYAEAAEKRGLSHDVLVGLASAGMMIGWIAREIEDGRWGEPG